MFSKLQSTVQVYLQKEELWQGLAPATAPLLDAAVPLCPCTFFSLQPTYMSTMTYAGELAFFPGSSAYCTHYFMANFPPLAF